jgi:hypothetical protein
MSVTRFLSDFLAFRGHAAKLAAQIEEGRLSPSEQARAVQVLLAAAKPGQTTIAPLPGLAAA